MESITNAATAATNAAASLLGYGNTSTTTTQEHESGQEPVSGLKGEGTVAEPYDSGNKVDDPVLGGEAHQKTSTTGASTLGSSTLGSSTTGASTLGSSTHPTSSTITDTTSSTTSGGLPTTGLSGRTARETADFATSAPIESEASSASPLSGLNSTSDIDTTYHQHNDAKTNLNAVTSGSIAPTKDTTATTGITTKDTASPIASTGVPSLDKSSHSHGVDSTSHGNSLAPNVAAAGGAGTTTGSPATPVKSSTSSATGTSGVSGVDEHGSGKKKLSDKIKEKLHIGSEHKKH